MDPINKWMIDRRTVYSKQRKFYANRRCLKSQLTLAQCKNHPKFLSPQHTEPNPSMSLPKDTEQTLIQIRTYMFGKCECFWNCRRPRYARTVDDRPPTKSRGRKWARCFWITIYPNLRNIEPGGKKWGRWDKRRKSDHESVVVLVVIVIVFQWLKIGSKFIPEALCSNWLHPTSFPGRALRTRSEVTAGRLAKNTQVRSWGKRWSKLYAK